MSGSVASTTSATPPAFRPPRVRPCAGSRVPRRPAASESGRGGRGRVRRSCANARSAATCGGCSTTQMTLRSTEGPSKEPATSFFRVVQVRPSRSAPGLRLAQGRRRTSGAGRRGAQVQGQALGCITGPTPGRRRRAAVSLSKLFTALFLGGRADAPSKTAKAFLTAASAPAEVRARGRRARASRMLHREGQRRLTPAAFRRASTSGFSRSARSLSKRPSRRAGSTTRPRRRASPPPGPRPGLASRLPGPRAPSSGGPGSEARPRPEEAWTKPKA